MQTAIATVCLSGTLKEKLEAIAAAKFKGVELFENDLLSYDGTPAEVRRIVEDLGLKTITFQPFRDFEGMTGVQRERVFTRAERKFDLMQELDCDLLMVCANVSPDSLGGIDRAAADLHELGERAAKRGLRVGFEALAWSRHINDYRDAWEAVRRANHPAIGLVLDTFHILARETEVKSIENIPRERIFLVQLADAPKLDMDYLSWSRHFRCMPGQGDLPILPFMEALLTTGFDGLLSLEIFNDQFRAGSARSVAIDGQRSLVFLLDQLCRQSGQAVTGLPTLPPRSICDGVEFIEFAIDETTAPSFEALLHGIGFRKKGIHRSKAVTRWHQGEINIVVNAEKDGFAHSYNITHGTAVAALALKVNDACATLDRAERLLDRPFRQAVGSGELEIPAVRGVGGGLLYFVDSKSNLANFWDVDFNAVSADGDAQSAYLTSVDHVSQSLHYGEMLSWLLFYTSLFDVSKTPAQDVIDPGGVLQSQVVQTEDGRLRIVLNASQSERTQSARFLSEFFGSGVQHIAFATSDIFAAAEQFRANDVKLLPIPENYYDDLEARIGLSAEQIDRLKAHNVLYDREGDAEFFQFYTQSFEEKFFFEIVERRGYKGFGAPNAPIRLAAQTRLARHPTVPRK
jgi:4-hydroxyphenylpyruvate dioxygenase